MSKPHHSPDPDLPRYIAAIRRWAEAKRRVRTVHIFGSRAIGGYTPKSDLDICVLAWPGDWEFDGLDWRKELADALPSVEVPVVENQGPDSDLVRRHGHEFTLAYADMMAD